MAGATTTTFNSNKNVKKEQLILFLNGNPVAYAKQATLTINNNITDTSNKFDGTWDSGIITGHGYTITTEALITEQTGAQSYKALMDAAQSESSIPFVFGTLSKTVDEVTGDVTGVAIDTKCPSWKGYINISSLELQSENKNLASSTLNATGTGKLVTVAAVAGA